MLPLQGKGVEKVYLVPVTITAALIVGGILL